MDIGVKIFPEDLAYAKRIAKYCDFFEVMAIPKSDFRSLKVLGRPFTIHTIHSRWGFNPANPDKRKLNLQAVQAAERAADILHADVIVVHPGHIESGSCSLNSAVSFISALDRRFIVENMPASTKGFPHIGCGIDDLSRMVRGRRRICLDFPHAAEYAHSCRIDYTQFIKGMIERFRPRYFHLSDTRIQDRKDMHLHLKEGNLKLGYFKSIVPPSSRILLETSHDFQRQHMDILLAGGRR